MRIRHWVPSRSDRVAAPGRDLKRVAREAAVPLLVDLRNVYNPVEARAAGLTYVSIGRS